MNNWRNLALALLLFGAGLGTGMLVRQPASHVQRIEAEPAPTEAISSSVQPANFIAEVVQSVGPAVVRIDATRTVEAPGRDFREDPSFQFPFFRRFFENLPEFPREFMRKGVGSGFVIGADGQVLTNAHVVQGADEVIVELQDGRTFSGEIVGTDELTDLALISIEAEELPTVPIGNSDRIQVGEWAIAIGNPLGLDSTVTAGIISATGRSPREIGLGNRRVRFIQTDTAINPGNSGGPLLNAKGEAIGVTTAIVRGASGVGFAIPINTAMEIAKQLVEDGEVQHAYLGIEMVALTPERRQQLNEDPNSGVVVDRDRGILVRRVVPDSLADEGGLRSGDIITHIDGIELETAEQLQQQVFNSPVGTVLGLGIVRYGETMKLEVETGAFPGEE